ncbi:hypothetical protein GDO78_017993 [Eleutherodactylus coqui]|uniref:5',3'-nucleotidase, mitochondrial n=1 Tax=Eleutherodactylus coqui TaxID=57060 RepID=A0A8J6BE99_ELECQ|nr:hypothetical protein GDO78_017993 [Eleutherodactylus coqui]
MNTSSGSVSPIQCPTSLSSAMSLPRLLRGGGTLTTGLQNCRPCSSSASSARRLRVLVDMDGVLADFEGGFLKKYRAQYPKEPYIALEDRRGFWVSEQYETLKPGLSEKAISIWEGKNFFLDLDPIDGAVEALREMSRLPKDKTVVSADLLIDDRPDIMGAEANPYWEHILFTACHNRHLLVTPPNRRLQSWKEDWKGLLDSKRQPS